MWYGPPLVRTQSGRGDARLAAACAGLALLVAVPAAVGADANGLRSQAERLRGVSGSLDTERQSALLQLYALESELEAERASADALKTRRAALVREHASTRHRLTIAKRAAALSTRRLEELVRRLYEQRGVDPLEVLLGARSLEDAMASLDSLDRAAAEQSRILERSRASRARLVRLDSQLTAREAELATLTRAADARAGELASRAAAKAAYVASLRRRQDFTARQVSTLEAAAQEQAETLQPAAGATAPRLLAAPVSQPIAPVVAADGTKTLTVSAIGYSLPGRTASGLPVGHGIVAVDPSVIPLGTRLYVPGYGDAVAADTGGAIQGAVIDLWFPTVAEAHAWGRRTVVITLG